MIRSIRDPEKPNTLEELDVVTEKCVEVQELGEDEYLIIIKFSPTVPHCSLATLIGESLLITQQWRTTELLSDSSTRSKCSQLLTADTDSSGCIVRLSQRFQPISVFNASGVTLIIANGKQRKTETHNWWTTLVQNRLKERKEERKKERKKELFDMVWMIGCAVFNLKLSLSLLSAEVEGLNLRLNVFCSRIKYVEIWQVFPI